MPHSLPDNEISSLPIIPFYSKKFILKLLRTREKDCAEEWFLKTLLHNLGNTVTALYATVDETKDYLPQDIHSALFFVSRYFADSIKTNQKFLQFAPDKKIFSPHLICKKTKLLLAAECRKHKISISVTTIESFLLHENSNLFQQILINILRNSIEAMQNRSAQKYIHVIIEKHHTYGIISVIDSGPGIEKNMLFKISQPGITSKSIGHGLGLAFVDWHMKKSFSGFVERTSRINQGLTTRLYFPLNPDIDTMSP